MSKVKYLVVRLLMLWSLCFVGNVYGIESSGLEYFSSPFLLQHQSGNHILILNSGIAAFQKRLDLIRQAKKTIVVEYFIYNLDRAGHLFSRELIKAARRGVRIRILVDKSLPVFKLNAFYAKEFAKEHIMVRYYNDASALQISTSQFRSHRKLFVIDDQIAITGGRNLADEYYDLSTEFNFLDRDILVEGPMAKVMRKSFDKFWQHEITVKPKFPTKPIKPIALSPVDEILNADYKEELTEYEDNLEYYQRKTLQAQEFMHEQDDDQQWLETIEEVARPILEKKQFYTCDDLTFASDLPGANGWMRLHKNFTNKFRVLRKVINQKISAAKQKVLLSSPYFVHNLKARKLYDKLIQKGVAVTTYTNSLGSTDAVYVAANYYRSVFRWVKEGMRPYIHSGRWIGETPVVEEQIKHAKWGTHAKTHVYDDDTIMIGTYNVDTRSNFYNAEMALFCSGNQALAAEVTASIHQRMKSGYRITGFNRAIDAQGHKVSVYGHAGKSSKILMTLIAIPSWIFSFLL